MQEGPTSSMPLRASACSSTSKKGVYVFDVTYEDGEQGTITLDSGAGVNVWPKNLKPNIPMEAKKQGLNMFAANGTPIEHVGTKTVRFKGIAAPFPRPSH